MSTSSLASSISDGSTVSVLVSEARKASVKRVKFDKCPRCVVQYDFLKRGQTSKVPLILNCKHTVCEDCIRRLFNQNLLFCPICNEQIVVSGEDIDNLPKLFTPHFALIGYLMWMKNGSGSRKPINWVSTGVTLNNKQLGLDLSDNELYVHSDTESEESGLNTSLMLTLEKCSNHGEEYEQIYCDNCKVLCCCYCFMENHGGHKPVYMHKLDENELKEFEQLKSHMEVLLKQLLKSKQEIKRLKSCDLSYAEDDVHSFFAHMHAKLHVAERNVKTRLHSIKTEDNDLDSVSDDLKSGIGRISNVINHFQTTHPNNLNLRALYEEAKALIKLPCRLASSQESSFQQVELVFENNLDDFENNIFMKAGTSGVHKLLPLTNWSEAQEKIRLNLIKGISESEQKNKDKENISTAESQSTKNGPVAGKSNEVVRVLLTHLNDLNSFYLQKYSTLDRLAQLNDVIEKRPRNSYAKGLKMGTVYGAQYDVKNKSLWRRGKLLSFESGQPNIVFKIFFIDYGNTQNVTKKLKELDFRTQTRQPFAFECKLTNPDNLDFGAKAHLRLLDIIGEKELYMRHVAKHGNGVEEVDLLVPTSNGSLISLRELLVKKVPITPEATKSLVFNSEVKLFKNGKMFSIGGKHEVVVTYVQDPFHIFVVLEENMKPLRNLKTNMTKYYDEQPRRSCIPVEGTDVVVKYEDGGQGKWHRATIIQIDSDMELARAYFVDWGFETWVPWASIRLLVESFIRMECQAIVVKLADIEKVEDEWSEEAVNILMAWTSPDKTCRLVVSDLKPLQAALFDVQTAEDICLNALLVEQNYAYSTGPLSETVYWPNMQDEEVFDEDMSFQMIKKSEEILMEEVDSDSINELKEQVSVVKCESPDLIYVKFQLHQNTEDDLHNNLQIHYNSERQTKNSWKKGQRCVVYESAKKCYARAVVKSPTKNFKYSVHLINQGRELEVEKNSMYVQDPHFTTYECGVYKCRLSDIKPAGDAGKWSNLAIEILNKIFSTHKNIFLKKTEINREEKMLGVVMWYSFTTPAKALEPSIVKYISINQMLLENGVAFGTKMRCIPAKPLSLHDDDDDDDVVNEDIVYADREEEKQPVKKESQNWCDMISEEENLITTWPKLYALPTEEFEANLICVDCEGFFLVRDEELHQCYLQVENSLSAKFNNTELEIMEWEVGDMCTITDGGKWYRGTVIYIRSAKEIGVEMIDFGSVHVVDKTVLSKYIMFPNVAPFVYKFQLYDVHSSNDQLPSLDDIMSIVSSKVRVVYKGTSNGIAQAEVYLTTGESVNELITKQCPYMYRKVKQEIADEETVKLKQEAADEETIKDETSDSLNNCYNYGPFPRINQKQKMEVLGTVKFGSEFIVFLRNPNAKSKFMKHSEELNDDLCKNGEQQPQLRKIKINQPCICLHPDKNVWCRAIIYNLDGSHIGCVQVAFVDHHHIELVPKKNLKMMKPEWFKYLVYNRMATVDIELVQHNMADVVVHKLNSLINKTVVVETVSESPLRVHLYYGQKLCYRNIIECGIAKVL